MFISLRKLLTLISILCPIHANYRLDRLRIQLSASKIIQ